MFSSVSLDLVRAQHTSSSYESDNLRLQKQVGDLEGTLDETKAALKTAEALASQLQRGLSERVQLQSNRST